MRRNRRREHLKNARIENNIFFMDAYISRFDIERLKKNFHEKVEEK